MHSLSGIYVGWVGKENLGDEALWEVCRSTFNQAQWILWSELSYRYSASRYVGHAKRDKSYLLSALREELRTQQKTRMLIRKLAHAWTSIGGSEVGMLGGGTLINREDTWLDAYEAIRQRTRKPVMVFGTGVAHPELWSAEPGWVDKRKEWVGLLEELPQVGVRGPVSKHLLEEAGARNVVIAGDPVVALHTPLPGAPTPGREEQRPRLGMNCGYSGRMWGKAEAVFEIQSSLARELGARGWNIDFFAVIPSELKYCERVAEQAGLDGCRIEPLTSSRAFFQRASDFDLVVAFKLHAGVLAAAANVPFLLLEYQPKCRDFAMSIDWERFTVRTDKLTGPDLLDLILSMAEQAPELQIEICRSMCALRETFFAYCRKLEPFFQA
jgi:polysaccharide pyruvyl transferase WcaK-like protein